MKNVNDNRTSLDEKHWKKMDDLYKLAERKNLLEAINRTDTEKFYLFTTMIRIGNTLRKVKSGN